MNKIVKIAVGSTSKHKVGAIKKACLNLGVDADVVGMTTVSGQNEQPEGFDQGYCGAFTRAQAVRCEFPDHIAIGIESFIDSFERAHRIITVDMACIVLLCSNGKEIVMTSSGVIFPEDAVLEARSRGFETTTVGSVIAERLGGDGTDPHALLTDGKVTREATLVSTLELALRQLPEIGS